MSQERISAQAANLAEAFNVILDVQAAGIIITGKTDHGDPLKKFKKEAQHLKDRKSRSYELPPWLRLIDPGIPAIGKKSLKDRLLKPLRVKPLTEEESERLAVLTQALILISVSRS